MTHNPDAGRPRGLSVRIKLTLSYAAFLVVAGIALFAVGFLLLRFVPEGDIRGKGGLAAPDRSDLLEVFIRYAWWALALLVIFGLVGGWLLAGRMLKPLDRITDVARRVRDGTLDQRVGLPGARDELTELADALDAMLDRVQHTIDQERRFAANASHELRTPHATIRTMVEVAQADLAGRDIDTVLERVGTTNDRAIAITEALLALARVERDALVGQERFELASVVAEVLEDVREDAAAAEIGIDTSFSSTPSHGSRILVRQAVTNIISNAVVHNLPRGGRISISTLRRSDGGVELTVANTGQVVDPAVVATLTEPFVRGAGRTRSATGHNGSGLGLALVDSIVRVHHGSLDVSARHGGGLLVRMMLPA